MYDFEPLRAKMLRELKEISDKEDFSRHDLDDVHKLTASITGLEHLTPHKMAAVHESDEAALIGERHSADHLTVDQAKKWVSRMKNADGTTGPHWSYEIASQLMAARGIDCNTVDFWATLCMMYSDYCKVARAYSADNPNFYADLAAAFLHDEDAAAGKLVRYWECIPDAH